MTSSTTRSPHLPNKFAVTRRGRKLQISDDPRTLTALPKDVPEKTWTEIIHKEDQDFICLEIREDIVEESLRIIHDRYMDRQLAPFTIHCAAQAWIKLIDWHFFRHDPGEEPTAAPLCYIPMREESWVPDQKPEPSPKDTWCRHDLKVTEEFVMNEVSPAVSECESLTFPVVEDIPKCYWFPAKVCLYRDKDGNPCTQEVYMQDLLAVPLRLGSADSKLLEDDESGSSRTSEDLVGSESEVLQRITDYTTDDVFKAKHGTPVDVSLQGAGDSRSGLAKVTRKKSREKGMKRTASHMVRSRYLLPPLEADSGSQFSIISDCRLRSLRLETQFEVSAERVEGPVGANSNSKKR